MWRQPMSRDEAAELLRDWILFGNDGQATMAWLRDHKANPRMLEAIQAFPEISEFGILDANVDAAAVAPTLQKLPNLECVQFVRCPRITDDILSVIVALPRLRDLELEATGIGDRGLAALSENRDLKSLRISNAAITDVGLATVAQLPSLQRLHITNDAITDAGLESLREHKSLLVVWASGTRITDTGMRHLATCPQLVEVLARQTQLTDAGIEAIAAAKNLKVLHAGGAFTRRSIDALAAAPELRQLLLEGDVQLCDEDIAAIGNLKHITRLDLEGARITPTGVERLRALLPNAYVHVPTDDPRQPE